MNDDFDVIKESIVLSEYISSYTKVVNGGKNKMAFCPFHDNTKTPAMSINDNQGLWKCFSGCGGGTIIDFWMKLNNVEDPREALENLAGEFNITLTTTTQNISKKRQKEALKKAYEFMLKQKTHAQKFINQRNLNTISEDYCFLIKETIPELIKHVDDKEALIKAGFLNENNYSNYHNRLIIPLYENNQIIGFAGRKIPGFNSSTPKWINPTNTPIYEKSEYLYGEISPETTLIVEGYFDADAINKANIPGIKAVACCGTTLTQNHAKQLAKTKNISLLFDADEAGYKAIIRTAWLLNEHPETTATILPNKYDPCSILLGENELKPIPHELTKKQIPLTTLIPKIINKIYTNEYYQKISETIEQIHTTLPKQKIINTAAHIKELTPQALIHKLPQQKTYNKKQTTTQKKINIHPFMNALIAHIKELTPQEIISIIGNIKTETSTTWFPHNTPQEIDALHYLLDKTIPNKTTTYEINKLIANTTPNTTLLNNKLKLIIKQNTHLLKNPTITKLPQKNNKLTTTMLIEIIKTLKTEI